MSRRERSKTEQEFYDTQVEKAKNLRIMDFGMPTGLLDRNGNELKLGDKFKYFEHEGYLLDDFTAEVVFENGAFGYRSKVGFDENFFTPFCEHEELRTDFLDWIDIVK